MYMRDIVDPPIAEWVVERRGVGKHRAHIRDVIDFPATYILVERRGAAEHPLHRRYSRGIPRADVVVKFYLGLEERAHVSDFTRIPR